MITTILLAASLVVNAWLYIEVKRLKAAEKIYREAYFKQELNGISPAYTSVPLSGYMHNQLDAYADDNGVVHFKAREQGEATDQPKESPGESVRVDRNAFGIKWD